MNPVWGYSELRRLKDDWVAWLLEKQEKSRRGKPGKRDPFPLGQKEVARELCGSRSVAM